MLIKIIQQDIIFNAFFVIDGFLVIEYLFLYGKCIIVEDIENEILLNNIKKRCCRIRSVNKYTHDKAESIFVFTYDHDSHSSSNSLAGFCFFDDDTVVSVVVIVDDDKLSEGIVSSDFVNGSS